MAAGYIVNGKWKTNIEIFACSFSPPLLKKTYIWLCNIENKILGQNFFANLNNTPSELVYSLMFKSCKGVVWVYFGTQCMACCSILDRLNLTWLKLTFLSILRITDKLLQKLYWLPTTQRYLCDIFLWLKINAFAKKACSMKNPIVLCSLFSLGQKNNTMICQWKYLNSAMLNLRLENLN